MCSYDTPDGRHHYEGFQGIVGHMMARQGNPYPFGDKPPDSPTPTPAPAAPSRPVGGTASAPVRSSGSQSLPVSSPELTASPLLTPAFMPGSPGLKNLLGQ